MTYLDQLDAALEFCQPGKPIPYDIVTNGIVLDENADPDFIDIDERTRLLTEAFGMRFEAEIDCFVTATDRVMFYSDIELTVPRQIVENEPNYLWWNRAGELQLHHKMASIPVGFEFEFYPFPDSDGPAAWQYED